MSRRKRVVVEPLPTIWEIPDELWDRILPVLCEFWPKKRTGRPVARWRDALNGVLFVMRSGIQWERLPRRFGPKSTVHDWFQRWVAGGVFEKIWAQLVTECDEFGAVAWRWQSADASLGKARQGGRMSAATPRIAGKTARNAAC